MSGPGWWHHYSKWFGEFLNGTLRGDGGECCRGCRESGHLATDPTHSRRRGLLSEGGRWRRWFGEALCCVDTLYYLWVGHSDLDTVTRLTFSPTVKLQWPQNDFVTWTRLLGKTSTLLKLQSLRGTWFMNAIMFFWGSPRCGGLWL